MRRAWLATQDILGHASALWIILVAGLLIRLMYAWMLFPDILLGDAAYYMSEAEAVIEGRGTEYYWPPGLIYLLVPFVFLFSSPALAGIAFSLSFWLLFVAGWHRMSGHFLTGWKGNVGLVLWSIFPAFIHQSVVPLSHLPIAAALCWCVHLSQKEKNHYLYPASFRLGLLGLIRPAVWAILPLALLFGWQRKLNTSVWILATLCFLFLPVLWEVHAYQETGRILRINDANAYNLYLGNHPQTPLNRSWWLGSHDVTGQEEFAEFQAQRDSIRSLDRASQANVFQDRAWGYIQADVGLFLRRSCYRFMNFWSYDILAAGSLAALGKPIAPVMAVLDVLCYGICMLFGLLFLVQGNVGAKWLLGLLGLYVLPYLLAFAHPTYHLPLLPFLLLSGLSWNGQLARKKIPFLTILLAIFVLIQVVWTLDLVQRMNI